MEQKQTQTRVTSALSADFQRELSAEPRKIDSSSSATVVTATIPINKHDVASAWLPTRHGKFKMHVFRNLQGEDGDSVLLEYGVVNEGDTPLVRLHSECMTGDVFGSRKCDCGEQLNAALSMIVKEKSGLLIYSRQEGRGIGLFNKIRAYELQERGFDTLDANLQLGLPADGRTYEPAAAMLKYLGVNNIRLITNNPAKAEALRKLGVDVVSTLNNVIPAHPENLGYLKTKAARMRHNYGLSAIPLALDFGADDGKSSDDESPSSKEDESHGKKKKLTCQSPVMSPHSDEVEQETESSPRRGQKRSVSPTKECCAGSSD